MREQVPRPEPASNIEFNALPELSWEPGRRGESLARLAGYVAAEAASAIDWYLRKKRSRQLLARTLRSSAIGATALAGKADVNDILKAEMDAWVAEFRAAIANIGKAAKARAEVARLGAANITVTSGEQCEDGRRLSVDGGRAESHRGTSCALRNLVPGMHTVTVTGQVGAAVKRAGKAFSVAAGPTASEELTLA